MAWSKCKTYSCLSIFALSELVEHAKVLVFFIYRFLKKDYFHVPHQTNFETKKESTQVLLITHFRCDRVLAQILVCRKIMIKLFIVFLFLETFVWHLQKRLETVMIRMYGILYYIIVNTRDLLFAIKNLRHFLSILSSFHPKCRCLGSFKDNRAERIIFNYSLIDLKV